MPSFLDVGNKVKAAMDLIEKAASADKINAKFVKVGSFLPRWDISHANEWNNVSGNFDMQSYLRDYLHQYGLDYTINGNDLIEVIAWP